MSHGNTLMEHRYVSLVQACNLWHGLVSFVLVPRRSVGTFCTAGVTFMDSGVHSVLIGVFILMRRCWVSGGELGLSF